MKVIDVVNLIEGSVLTKDKSPQNNIETGFVGDLLSVVMGKSPSDAAWITIQSHINIVAVATLIEAACIIVTEGYKVDEDAISKADEEAIHIISTKLSSYQVACKLCQAGIKA